MKTPIKIWKKQTSDLPVDISEMSRQLNIAHATAQILVNRGITDMQIARVFLDASVTELTSPYLFEEMHTAVARIKDAIVNKEKILIYGDYDVDGITSVAILYDLLKKLGALVEYHIPDRIAEGYGLNINTVSKYIEQKVNLIVTVDCGISNFDEITLAQENDVDVILTDHHEPASDIPPAHAIINPKLEEHEQLKYLAGVGVSFKLAQAICIDLKIPQFENVEGGEYLDLVALGTIADIVPLVSENRILVKNGLKMLENSWRPGIRALIKEVQLENKKITTGAVGYVLAPRLNAAGRIASPEAAIELLLSEDDKSAQKIAAELNSENIKRQNLERDIFEQADKIINTKLNLDGEKCIVVAAENWHPGVIGIVASKIVEKYHRPTIVIALDGDEGKGSARSIEGFDMHQGLSKCANILLKFGGHKQAAGLSIQREMIPKLRKELNTLAAKELTELDLIPKVRVDVEVAVEEINYDLLEQLEQLEPFGFGNPNPILACSGVKIKKWDLLGKERGHLKLQLNANTPLQGIGFNMGDNYSELLKANGNLNLAFSLEKNSWNGQESLQLKIKDIKPYYSKEKLMIPQRKWVNLYDRRNLKCKVTYIKNQITSKDVIYFHNREKAEAFTKDIISQDSSNAFRVIVANQPYSHQEGEIRNMFFYDFPLHWEDLNRITSSVDKIDNIHLLYSVNDCYNLEDLKEQKFLNRNGIGMLYKGLKRLAKQRNDLIGERQEVLKQLKELAAIDEEEILLGLAILAQLKLLKWEQNNNEIKISILKEPADKLSLYDSQVYTKIMDRRNQLDAWYSFLMYASLDDLLSLYHKRSETI